MCLEDRAGKDIEFLANDLDKFLPAARKRAEIGQISTTFLPSVPQEFVNVDRDKVLKQGVALTDGHNTIQAFMGGLFVNYFNDFGRTWQVCVQAEARYRANPRNLGQLYVRPPEVPSGLPSSLLARRPDISQAEQNLIAANAEIGVAKAACFLQIALTASGGGANGVASIFGGILDSNLATWSYGANITQSIFRGGQLRGNLPLVE